MTSGAQNEDMHVASLWRYPVKSMQGETCAELEIERNGVAHDRGFGVLDVQSGTIISAKREGRMLEAAAKLVFDEVVVTLPGGQELDQGDVLDECLTRWLGRAVRLVDATTYGVATFESPNDFERDDSALESWEGVEGKFVDDSALHLLTTADLENLTSERQPRTSTGHPSSRQQESRQCSGSKGEGCSHRNRSCRRRRATCWLT
jgi:uncharacterized protein YcbX